MRKGSVEMFDGYEEELVSNSEGAAGEAEPDEMSV